MSGDTDTVQSSIGPVDLCGSSLPSELETSAQFREDYYWFTSRLIERGVAVDAVDRTVASLALETLIGQSGDPDAARQFCINFIGAIEVNHPRTPEDGEIN